MCQTNKLIVNTPLGGISLCTLDELYTADRDIVAKLIGYLALSRAYNLVNDTMEMIAQVDDVEMIVTCRAAFECAYMDFAQKRAGSPIFEQLYALYQSARMSGLYASIPLMTEVYHTAIAIPGYTLADNQYILALGEMLAGLIPLCKALEAQLSDLQTAWITVERMVAHPDDVICVSNCNQFLLDCDALAGQGRDCAGDCQGDCQGGHSRSSGVLSVYRMAAAAEVN